MLFTGGGKDEERYRHWVEQNQHGYVINYRPDFGWMKLHRATCGSIQMDDLNYTTSCFKACSLFTPVLRDWARTHKAHSWFCQHCID